MLYKINSPQDLRKLTIEELKESVEKQKAVIFIDFTGLKVEDMFELRRNLKKADSQLKVAKKTIIQLVFKEKGLKIDPEKLKGEIALVFGYKDEISPSKAAYKASEKNPNLRILGGFLENKFREAEEFITLAQIPPKEELLTRLAGSMLAPVTNFVRALEYNLKGLVYILSSIKK